MSETDVWFTDPKYPNYRCKILQKNNAITRIYQPILSDEERERRMERIRQAARDLVKAEMIAKKKGVANETNTSKLLFKKEQ